MVNNAAPNLDHTFDALRDPTRRGMVRALAQGPVRVKELSAPYAMSKPAITKHLRVLERAGLLEREVRGREHWCRLNEKPLAQLEGWLAEQRALWEGLLDSLQAHLEGPEEKETEP